MVLIRTHGTLQYLLEFGIFGNMLLKTCRIAAKTKWVGRMLFVILVDFHLKPGAQSQFRRLIDENAQASVKNEPGCLQFDVLEPEGEADRVLLYEIYTDRAAFDAHLKTEHFRIFADASKSLFLDKKVMRCGLAFSGGDVASKKLNN